MFLTAAFLFGGCDGSQTGLDPNTVRVEGTVLSQEGREAVQGAEIAVDVVAGEEVLATMADTTDSEGAFALEAVVPGGCTGDSAEVVLHAVAADYAELVQGESDGSLHVPCAETATLDVELYRNAFRDPQAVAGDLVPTQLSVGRKHACAVTAAGAYCWGSSLYGRLGNASVTDDYAGSPVAVTNGQAFTQIAAGNEHTCALDADGAAWCWGLNIYGAVGADTSDWRVDEPFQVQTDLRFVQIQAGRWQSCGLTADGLVYCWGEDRGLGLGGSVSFQIYLTPQPVALEGSYVDISTVHGSTCALQDTGEVYCWGFSYDGELGGAEESGHHPLPVRVAGEHEWGEVDTGVVYGCGLTTAGAAYCWGQAYSGKLGNGSLEDSSVPVPVSGGHVFSEVRAGEGHTCALTAAGVGWCWGSNDRGELGTPASGDEDCLYGVACVTIPVEVPTNLTFSTLQAGGAFTCGVTTDQEIVCWGARELLGSGRTLANAP